MLWQTISPRRSSERATQSSARRANQRSSLPRPPCLIEQARLHTLPSDLHTAALGESPMVGDDQTVSFGSVRCPVPRAFVRESV